jgi:hypothetical protein
MTKLEDIMNKLAICATAALIGGLGSLSAPSIAANAQGFEIEIGPNGSQLRLRDEGCDPRYERCRRDYSRDDDNWRDGARPMARRFRTERALNKSEQMGIRRARVVSAGRREVVVGGRDQFGQRVAVAFGRERRCPVIE